MSIEDDLPRQGLHDSFEAAAILAQALKDLRQEGRYRVFNNITRKKGEFPKAVYNNTILS